MITDKVLPVFALSKMRLLIPSTIEMLCCATNNYISYYVKSILEVSNIQRMLICHPRKLMTILGYQCPNRWSYCDF